MIAVKFIGKYILICILVWNVLGGIAFLFIPMPLRTGSFIYKKYIPYNNNSIDSLLVRLPNEKLREYNQYKQSEYSLYFYNLRKADTLVFNELCAMCYQADIDSVIELSYKNGELTDSYNEIIKFLRKEEQMTKKWMDSFERDTLFILRKYIKKYTHLTIGMKSELTMLLETKC